MQIRPTVPEPAVTLADEHAQLLADLDERTQPILNLAPDSVWPADDLYRLLDYLHVEVLRQVVDEEWLLFRAAHHRPDTLGSLREQHQRLRDAIDELTAVEQQPEHPPVEELVTAVRRLRGDFEDHLRSEQLILGEDSVDVPSTSAMGSQPHSLFALTEGPVIDLDNLPGPHGIDAVLGRLLRLRRGERIEVHGATDPSPLWRRLAMSDPGGYGFSYLERGPERWRVEVERRVMP